MLIEFDCDADLIDVPSFVVENRELLRRQFLKWLYKKGTKHKYWVVFQDNCGRKISGIRFRSDAFVEWLNKKVLTQTLEKAVIIQQHIYEYPNDMPSIFF